MDAGRIGVVVHVVTRDDTAVVLKSGDVSVLGTPRVVALVEEASVSAVHDALEDGETTVGTHIDLEHLRATAVGASVEATAMLEAVDGPRLEFAVTVRQHGREIARGRLVRAVVDRERFLSRL